MQIAQSNGPNKVGTSSHFCLRTETDGVSEKFIYFLEHKCYMKFKSSVVLNAIYHHQNPAEVEASFGH